MMLSLCFLEKECIGLFSVYIGSSLRWRWKAKPKWCDDYKMHFWQTNKTLMTFALLINVYNGCVGMKLTVLNTHLLWAKQ